MNAVRVGRVDRIDGIDEPLPAGERLLWQGAPEWRTLAVRRFHVRKVAGYFALLVGWRALAAPSEPQPWAYFAVGAAWLLVLAALVVGAVCLLAWLVARTTTYAVTDRRVVMRIGVALPSLINIPLRLVGSAACLPYPDGTGNLALSLERDGRFAWLLLWPHNRPWRFSEPQPTLLAVPDCLKVGAALREALLAGAEVPGPAGHPADVGRAGPVAVRKLVSVP